jgi:hypothetical protein
MLYDPKWEKTQETKVDPISIAALIAWMETQNPEQNYNFHNWRRALTSAIWPTPELRPLVPTR